MLGSVGGDGGSPAEAAQVLSHWSEANDHSSPRTAPSEHSVEQPAVGSASSTAPATACKESPFWHSAFGLHTGLDWHGEQTAPSWGPHFPGANTAQGLDPRLRAQFEKQFGEDFSGVEIKRGLSSGDQRSGVRAVAEHERVTVDSMTLDRQYEPEQQEVLAEELAHIVQKRRGRITPDTIDAATGARAKKKPVTMAKSDRGRLEEEAERAAAAVVRGERPQIAAGAQAPARQFRLFDWAKGTVNKVAGSMGSSTISGLGKSAVAASVRGAVPAAELAIGKIGGAFDDGGINLHVDPDTKSTLVVPTLPFGTRFLIQAELPGGWYKVRVLGGRNGYVAKHLTHIAPEPGALLHKITKDDTAIGIAERFYKSAVKPGEDLRFFVNVLSYVNPTAIAKPAPDDSWKKANALQNFAIWVPSAAFALSLRGKVGSGSITGGLWAQVRDASAYVIRTLIEQLPGGKSVMAWLQKVGPKIANVLSRPGQFLGNLVTAVKTGFNNFTGNIVTNIEKSIITLLTGSMSGQGISMPAKFDATGVLKLGLQVMGISRTSFEAQLVKQGVPRSALNKLEKIAEVGPLITDINKNGLAPTLQKYLADTGSMKDMLFSGLKDWIITQAIKQGLITLASFFVPGGGLVQLAIKIYDTVMFIIDKMTMIKNVVTSIVSSLSDIVDGKVDAAAKQVENALQLGLTLGLGFLANLAKLGSIAQKVKELLARMRKSVDSGLNKLAKFVADKVRPLLAKLSGNKPTPTASASNANRNPTTKSPPDPQHDAKVATGLAQIDTEEAKIDPDGDNQLTKEQTEKVAKTVKKNNPVFTNIIAHYDVLNNKIEYEWFASYGTQQSSRKPYTNDLEPAKSEGTEKKPFPIPWPKPASADYEHLYFGGERTREKSQEQLKKLHGKLDDTGVIVKRYAPHENSTLAGGHHIGVLQRYHLNVGTIIGPIAPAGKGTPGGLLLNNILQKYGFRAGFEKLDGDHIHEIQLGGPNEMGNMWPLSQPLNRGAGSSIDQHDIKLRSGKSLKVYQLREHVKQSNRKYYFKVQSTR